jgi:hypothetical protein
MDQTKKTMRHFYCRDVLWETFEAMANDFDCSIDYLVNESMRLYARSKNYQVPGAGASPSQILHGTSPGSPLRAQPTTPSPSSVRGTASGLERARPAPGPPSGQLQAQGQQTPGASPYAGRLPLPPSGASSGRSSAPTPPAMPLTPAAPPSNAGLPSSTTAPSNWSPPLSVPPNQASEPPAPPLYLVFNNQRFLVDKDQFVIGRGSKTADLAIKDGNISRKHAVVLRRNGVYYIKDLGSTNGIEYKGMRIDNKRIDEGDVFAICDYEIRFTYLA